MRHHLGIEERPETVFFDPLHEKVGHPVGEIQVVSAPGAIAGVVAQLQKLFDIGVPSFQIAATSALPFTALIHRRDRRIERFEPWNDAVGETVGALDERAARAYTVIREPDAAGEFRQLGHVGVTAVDRFKIIPRRVEQITRRHLRMARARIEQRRRAHHVFERREQAIKFQRLADAFGQTAGNAHEKVLRRLDHLARLRIAQEIAVVKRAQAEVLEEIVALVLRSRR